MTETTLTDEHAELIASLNAGTSDASAAAVAVAMLSTPIGIQLQEEDLARPMLVSVPAGRSLQSVAEFYDENRMVPLRKRGVAKLNDLQSLIDHANRFKNNTSALFAMDTPSAPSISCVLNYHAPADGDPAWGDHRGIYQCALSDEWKAWSGAHQKHMSQSDFAAFIEERLPDVADPSKAFAASLGLATTLGIDYAAPSKLLATSRGLAVRVDQRCETATNLATGEVSFVFIESHAGKDGGPMSVPAAFLIEVPVFRNGAPYQLAVRLRYRLRDGKTTFFCELYRAQSAFDHAFTEACEKAATETELPIFYGSPEA